MLIMTSVVSQIMYKFLCQLETAPLLLGYRKIRSIYRIVKGMIDGDRFWILLIVLTSSVNSETEVPLREVALTE